MSDEKEQLPRIDVFSYDFSFEARHNETGILVKGKVDFRWNNGQKLTCDEYTTCADRFVKSLKAKGFGNTKYEAADRISNKAFPTEQQDSDLTFVENAYCGDCATGDNEELQTIYSKFHPVMKNSGKPGHFVKCVKCRKKEYIEGTKLDLSKSKRGFYGIQK
jgi:hypothetical protein